MTSPLSPQPVTALRARMIEDMMVRGFTEETRNDYVRHVRAFAAFIRRPPDTATADDLRRFQLHQRQSGMQPPSINNSVSALRFFFTATLDRPDLARRLTVVREPLRLPAVLSVEEVTLLLQSAPGAKYKAALGTAYGAGLRVSEVVALKVGDIDSERMLLRVEQGKGRKDRRDQEAGVDAHAAAQLRPPPVGTGHRHPRHPSAARSRQAGDHSALHPRRHHHDPQCDQPARPACAAARCEAESRSLARRR